MDTITTYHGEVGRYEVAWHGHDDRGQAVAPGVYFYRMQTTGHSETRKMIKIQ